jgi:hypothetical protein
LSFKSFKLPPLAFSGSVVVVLFNIHLASWVQSYNSSSIGAVSSSSME